MDKLSNFIEKARIMHPGENLDYSNVVYINNRTPVEIIDHDLDENGNEYGSFWQTPSNHLKGQGHPAKRGNNISKSKRLKQSEIIERFKLAHPGENIDYSEVVYINMHTKVKIIDHDLDENGNEYGEYWQEPVVHLKGCGHKNKGKRKQIESLKYTTDIFVRKCKELYKGEDYSYDNVSYVNSKTKVDIFCNKVGSNGKPHGIFKAYPDLFLQGKSCPICGNHKSIAETEIYDLLVSIVGEENVVKNDKHLLNGFELDLYVPSKKFAIEYNGLRWHSELYKNDKLYHINKTKKCLEQGVTLIQIFEDEYISNKILIFDKIRHFLGANDKTTVIHARKSYIKEICKKDAEIFLNKFHIQGFVSSSIYLGCFYDGILYGVMSFKKENNKCEKWELTRYCTDINYKCQGFASKLFSFFVNKYKPDAVKSFLDYRWCNSLESNVYTKLGFKQEEMLKPDYRYTNGHGKRLHKFGFRKQILHKKYGFDLSMTEYEMAKKLGYYKIWDCGLVKYVWHGK